MQSFQVVPRELFKNKYVESLPYNEKSGILHKHLQQPMLNKASFISVHVICIILNGEQRIHTYDGEKIRLQQNKMVFLPKGIYTISDLMPTQSPYESLLFFLDDSIIQEFETSLPTFHSRTNFLNLKEDEADFKQLSYSENIKFFVEAILHFFRTNQKPDEVFIKLKLLELLHLVQLNDSDNSFIRFLLNLNRGRKRNIIEFMENNFDKPLKVEDYAYLCGRSLSSFRREFKKYFKTTPSKWLKEKRLEKAYHLLATTDSNVTDAAFEVGYENISYFIKEFRKKYHLSPKQFILQKRENLLAV